jgi:hypothetical protein
MITLMVSLGLAVLVAWPCAGRWVWLVPALGGGLMGVCLLPLVHRHRRWDPARRCGAVHHDCLHRTSFCPGSVGKREHGRQRASAACAGPHCRGKAAGWDRATCSPLGSPTVTILAGENVLILLGGI